MKKILMPTILLTGITPIISLAGCNKSSIIKINVNQNITTDDFTELTSDIFVVNSSKKYRLNINCSSSTASSWKDEGHISFRTFTWDVSPATYDVTYVKLDGEKLTSGDHTKGYWIEDTAGESNSLRLFFRWEGHTLSKNSKMTIDVKFRQESDLSEVCVLWQNWNMI